MQNTSIDIKERNKYTNKMYLLGRKTHTHTPFISPHSKHGYLLFLKQKKKKNQLTLYYVNKTQFLAFNLILV